MTGPQHYQEAEKLVAAANKRLATNGGEWLNTTQRRAELRADALIHATLAHAAATALGSQERDIWRDDSGMHPRDRSEWEQAAGGEA